MKARKKPVIVEAVQWNGKNVVEIYNHLEDLNVENQWEVKTSGKNFYIKFENGACRLGTLMIKTLEGEHKASIGDYIIKGVNGEFYPCKPDIFEKTYEIVNESEQYEQQKHYENLKSWVDGNLICEYDDPVWNKEAYEAIHFILDDYKKRIDYQLTVEEINALICYISKSIGVFNADLLNTLKLAYMLGEEDLSLCINAIDKLQKQKEKLKNGLQQRD